MVEAPLISFFLFGLLCCFYDFFTIWVSEQHLQTFKIVMTVCIIVATKISIDLRLIHGNSLGPYFIVRLNKLMAELNRLLFVWHILVFEELRWESEEHLIWFYIFLMNIATLYMFLFYDILFKGLVSIIIIFLTFLVA